MVDVRHCLLLGQMTHNHTQTVKQPSHATTKLPQRNFIMYNSDFNFHSIQSQLVGLVWDCQNIKIQINQHTKNMNNNNDVETKGFHLTTRPTFCSHVH
jgi:hypothetical protein